MLKGFKEFILRGNVIDLAVAVVIGAAFTAIVTVVVQNLINPLVGMLLQGQNLDKALIVTVGSAQFGFGAIIAAVINFLAVAAVVYFAFVLPMNTFKARQEAKAGTAPAETLPSEQELLLQIRDLLEKNQAR
ncbi:large conductance mechanosensitive channel [Microbacterium resistens]|uniref:Large-conductance mechanosensitive channel n=1 Tax=Microbacterium resistens TaxID=156977 RepID=A0ABU1SJ31_9MICO|nr:large conductance mechanosensitive channel protein MscL [Microbacterium resistens]MDR6868897.1 large conductance mechanosensitive channel [Microbacterium resistens]